VTYRTVLFDLDGTLTDPAEGITRGVQLALASVGIDEPDPARLVGYIGPPVHDGLAEFHGLRGSTLEDAVAVYRAYYRREGYRRATLIGGIDAVLCALVTAGTVLAVATSKPEPVAELVLDHFGLTGRFSVIGGASYDDTRRAKAEVVAHTLTRLRGRGHPTDPRDAVLVGDRHHDVTGARRNGLGCVGVRWGFAQPGELEAAGALWVAERPGELLGLATGA
jgi:phosphoglycolate phosphatase